jgi:hypothetical protein
MQQPTTPSFFKKEKIPLEHLTLKSISQLLMSDDTDQLSIRFIFFRKTMQKKRMFLSIFFFKGY